LIANEGEWRAKQIIICLGSDLQTLFPKKLPKSGVLNCHLQIVRTIPQPDKRATGPLLSAGLTPFHYPAFTTLKSCQALKTYLVKEQLRMLELGILVLVSQHGYVEVTIVDFHEYLDSPSIFY
jgi:hypothetical protein